MGKKTSSLFLTEVDHHHPKQLTGKKLRHYIILNSLFYDRLLIGDSQINNNEALRNLIWNGESNLEGEKGIPQDLHLLLEEGYILPVVRNDYNSLQILRTEHEDRAVTDTPSEQYVDFIEEKLEEKRVTFDINEVSQLFKNRVLEAFTTGIGVGRGRISKEKCKIIVDYVESQDKLLYKSLRDWAKGQINIGTLNQRDYKIMDRVVAGAYRHNIPLSIGTKLDRPIQKSRDYFLEDIFFGDEDKPLLYQNKPETTTIHLPLLNKLLSNNFLSKIPSEFLIYIKGSKKQGIDPSPHYLNVKNQINEYLKTGTLKYDDFINDLNLYTSNIMATIQSILQGPMQDFYFNLQKMILEKHKSHG